MTVKRSLGESSHALIFLVAWQESKDHGGGDVELMLSGDVSGGGVCQWPF